MTDEPHIIQRVLDGDTESFRLLVERYARAVVDLIVYRRTDPRRGDTILSGPERGLADELH